MRNYKKHSILPVSFFLFFTAFSLGQSFQKPIIVISKQDSTLNLNNKMIQNFNLGYNRLESSLLWIMTILESDIDHYKSKDLNSWMFLRFLTISELEPNFYENYSFGGVYLSIVKDDIAGASIIYNKGLKIFPTDFYLLKNASFHFFFEAKDSFRSFELTQVVKKIYPKKKGFLGMTTQLEAEHGKLEDALSTLDQYQQDFPLDSLFGKKVFQKRYALKAEIDLNCLNILKKSNCSLRDLNNELYVKKNSVFSAKTDWIPYRRKSLKMKN